MMATLATGLWVIGILAGLGLWLAFWIWFANRFW